MENHKLRILILADESWNDYIFGNGVLTNWFTDFDAEFAEIYLSPNLPNNEICNHYFRITDKQMLKSIIGKRAGGEVCQDKTNCQVTSMHQGIYVYLKKISMLFHTPMMMIRDLIWSLGRYNIVEMRKFIEIFKPDVIFSARLGSVKLFRIEKLLSQISSLPIIAFTGDNEIGYDCFSYSPLFWIRRWYTTRMFKRNKNIYSHYFMHSQQQANWYTEKYKIPTSTLFKCSIRQNNNHISTINHPIIMVYAGRLYCNRWKTLAQIGKALKIINQEQERIRLDIYTSDELTSVQKKSLNQEYSIYIHPAVTASELTNIYNSVDIALHVESFDKKYRLLTKYSFSTKIIDLLASGCAVMAICWDQQTGYQYLKSNDAALCISNYSEITSQLQKIITNPALIKYYAKKAQQCAQRNHQRNQIQAQLLECFKKSLK